VKNQLPPCGIDNFAKTSRLDTSVLPKISASTPYELKLISTDTLANQNSLSIKLHLLTIRTV
jgi:hypothetical protein